MGKLVLLVEDDEDNRDLVQFVFTRSRLDVDLMMAENGQDALSCIKKIRPDLILMDMQMPVMDGYTAVPIIKSNPELKSIPIIAFTALARPEDVAKSRAIGCLEHHTKPIDPEDLLNLVRRYIFKAEK
jgi:two-component system, cell cycle response regulator DivK